MAVLDRPEFWAALHAASPAMAMREIVQRELERSLGGDRDRMLEVLEGMRAHLRRIGRLDAEDGVLEVMDFVTGWCSPHVKI